MPHKDLAERLQEVAPGNARDEPKAAMKRMIVEKEKKNLLLSYNQMIALEEEKQARLTVLTLTRNPGVTSRQLRHH